MEAASGSVPDRPTIALNTDALILRHYAELAFYAVQLATKKISPDRADEGDLGSVCDECQIFAEPNQPIQHDESCMVGRIFRLSTVIAMLKCGSSDRTILYFPHSTPAGEHVPARLMTHEEAAQGECA